MADSDDALAGRLAKIADLLRAALELADESDEFMLGAKLSDSLVTVQARIEALGRRT